MVEYIFCTCGKVVDEYEKKCHWCNKLKEEIKKEQEEKENESNSSFKRTND
jgi:thioredoxin-related protein